MGMTIGIHLHLEMKDSYWDNYQEFKIKEKILNK